ncbi:serine/threonine protein kinase (Kcc4), putative [Talaromyces stipitatus ATCC 10500]|uniref:non-specific serine/threonine protein kinase n=1 Tax=Talaromyces stipitatus (strain ATCC 10500 / CBS 375.48 / QM 6759 / NRRL 1006) TaxID=441959 RepID=B8M6H2_TALSN|nr:serine/threonine protein kinase (Kcc4), putative [Talaromyces stipitatus ATCC 10500]EED19347.1 serine/threonine protein kinase (Kcc4), putative [Talaromyces stipitatus ATCC 10500]
MDDAGTRSAQGRQPLTDAAARVNHGPTIITPGIDGTTPHHEHLKSFESPQPQTLHNSPVVVPDTARLSVATDSPAHSNRNSAISTTSTASGKGKRKTHVGPWQLGRTLGKGATGRVRLAKHAVTGQAAAIKIVSKKSAAMVQSESIAAMDRNACLLGDNQATRPMPFGIEREVVIMKLIEHPNVINLYDIWENRGELYLVLEYVEGGELFDYVSTHGPLPEEEAVRLFRQIISGLAYCHRFNICHRDLKPENILLDPSHNVKLADFGMAALQPAGHWLNTSCGSPHYAAPEIIYGRRYRGDKADIWSCGIILFALLTGFLPFDGGDLSNTLQLVKKGNYHIPTWLSVEAANMIQRILQKRPEDRISIQNMFNHPLLKKYEILHQAMSQHPLGPPPPLSAKDCGPAVASRAEIDLELLRSLQTLWHSANTETLIERLLSQEPNHEKMFYNALIKFRDEQLENYHGQPLEYSASDYHHISRPPAATRAVAKHSKNGRIQGHSRRRSQFSILTESSRRSNSGREPKSSASYDPFRASRTPVATATAQYASVTIHREDNVHKTPEDIVVEVEGSLPSSPPRADVIPSSSVEIIQWNRKKKSQLSFHSRSSLATSRRGYSPAPQYRAGYRRNVSFRHIRNRSGGGSSAKSATEHSKSQSSIAHLLANDKSSNLLTGTQSPGRMSSPVLPAQPAVVRTSEVVASLEQDILVRKIRDNFWGEEARKVSHELSQICEEAFNRSSVSTRHTAVSTETTATSMSIHEEEAEKSRAEKSSDELDKIGDLPASYTVKELAETRRKLIEHSTKAEAAGLPDYLCEVIAHLDRLIEQDIARNKAKTEFVENPNRRTLSEPLTKPVDTGYLPSISEEIFTPLETSSRYDLHRVDHHATPDPSPRVSQNLEAKSTIRVVPKDSSLPSIDDIKPLTIRKRNAVTDAPSPLSKSRHSSADSVIHIRKQGVSSEQRTSSDSVATSLRYNSRAPMVLETISESSDSRRSSAKSSSNGEKKWSWFGKQKSYVHEENIQEVTLPSVKTAPAGSVSNTETSTDAGEKKPPRKASGEKSRPSFLKMFTKKKAERVDSDSLTGDSSQDQDDTLRQVESNDTAISHVPVHYSGRRARRPSGASQNWFARFFHVKPALRVMAFNVPKAKIRKEIYRTLRDWKVYGMNDVYLDRAENVVRGRVCEKNFLHLRPVEFSAEFFTVLEHSRHANLSLVRFRQERGAASSFHKVLDHLESFMKKKGFIVQDPVRSKKMVKILDNVP